MKHLALYAKNLFTETSQRLIPNVFLIGILRESTRNGYPICIEPEECGIDVNSFNDIDELSKGIYEADPRKNLVNTNPDLHKRNLEDLKEECLIKAVKQTVDKNFKDREKVSFVSSPVLLDE